MGFGGEILGPGTNVGKSGTESLVRDSVPSVADDDKQVSPST